MREQIRGGQTARRSGTGSSFWFPFLREEKQAGRVSTVLAKEEGAFKRRWLDGEKGERPRGSYMEKTERLTHVLKRKN